MSTVGLLAKAIARENLFLTSLVLAADLANNATLSGVPYPVGTNQQTFLGSVVGPQALVVVVNKNDIWSVAGGQIAITFGTATLSIQNKSGVVWAANSAVDLQLDAVSGLGAASLAIDTVGLGVNLADIAAGTLNLDLGYSGVILGSSVRVIRPATTAAKLATLTPHIAGVAVVGGAVALTSANVAAIGAAVAGAAITGGPNPFTSIQAVGFIATAVTAFVEGSVVLQLKVSNSDLAGALSAILTN